MSTSTVLIFFILGNYMTTITRRFALCVLLVSSFSTPLSFAANIVHVLDFPSSNETKAQTSNSNDILVKNHQPIAK